MVAVWAYKREKLAKNYVKKCVITVSIYRTQQYYTYYTTVGFAINKVFC